MSRNKQSRKHLIGRSYKNDEFDWPFDLVTVTCKYNPKVLIDLMHNDVILWSRRLKSFENGYS